MDAILSYFAFILFNEILLTQVSSQDSLEPLKRMKRIIGGQTADIKDFKSIVSLTLDGEHTCSGTLIRNPQLDHLGCSDLIITSAHCVVDPNTGKLIERIFDIHVYSVNDYGKREHTNYIRVQSALWNRRQGVHSNYPRGLQLDDLAVIQLEEHFYFNDDVQPMDLAPANGQLSPFGKIAGWGSTVSSAPDAPLSPTLHYAFVEPVDVTNCDQHHRPHGQLICVRGLHSPTVNVASGDSGGPLIMNGALYGVIMGDQIYQDKAFIAIVSIPVYRPWIDQTIQQLNS